MRRQQQHALQATLPSGGLESVDLALALGKPNVVSVKSSRPSGYVPVVSIDGSKEQHEFSGYRFMTPQSLERRIKTMTVPDIVGRESGADAKAKI